VTDRVGAVEQLLGLADLRSVGEDHPEIAHGICLSGPGPAPEHFFVATLSCTEVVRTARLPSFGDLPSRPDGPHREHAPDEHRGP
jgi:hypothetical protein